MRIFVAPIVILAYFLLNLIVVKNIYADDFYFQDEFNADRFSNTLDLSNWIIYPNNAPGYTTIKESNGFLKMLQKNNSNTFPLILSRILLPDTDFKISLKYQYTKVTYWGTGIAFTEEAPFNGGPINSFGIGIWQDRSVGPNMRISFDGKDIITLPTNTNEHILDIEYINNRYLIFLDNELIYTSNRYFKKIKYIWMGNPTYQYPPVPEWTSFNVDYVRVQLLSPKPFLGVPWDYKSKGLSFDEAALAINSFFDHDYPYLSSGQLEPASSQNSVLPYFSSTKQTNLWYSSHDGYDYGKKAKLTLGDNILAAAPGWATYVNTCKACGNMVVIDHQNGYQTRYMHLLKTGLITQNPGEKVWVEEKSVIGKVGATGRVLPAGPLGAHLHFDVYKDIDGDGSFNNNILNGATDPYGWQSENPDPWESIGTKSYYLWKEYLSGLDMTLSSNGGLYNIGSYSLSFPVNSTTTNLETHGTLTPNTKFNNFTSLLPPLSLNSFDPLDNPVNNLDKNFTLTADLTKADLTKILTDTISFYTSSDGNNWEIIPTNYNPDSKTVSTTLNHLSFIGVFAQRSDNTPPNTTADLSGSSQETNWFNSEVQISLSSKDNQGGLGVDYILYKLDNLDWEQYLSTINISSEGHHKIEFYAVDNDGNVEEVKAVEFDIDLIPPEVLFYIDKTSKQVTLTQIDNNPLNITLDPSSSTSNPIYLVTDKAGNKLTLKAEVQKKNKKWSIEIKSIKYNNQPIQDVDKNELTGAVRGSFGHLTDWEQLYTKESKPVIRLSYDSRRNKTTIFEMVGKKEKIKSTKTGEVILKISTSKGKLIPSY